MSKWSQHGLGKRVEQVWAKRNVVAPVREILPIKPPAGNMIPVARAVRPTQPILPAPLAYGVTAIIVNFKTRDLTRGALKSLQSFYPDLPVVLVDNGSDDASTKFIRSAGEHEGITAVLHKRNLGHGPALDDALSRVATAHAFLMDSDCVVQRGGFLEEMQALFTVDPLLYAAGWLRWVDRKTGVPLEWHVEQPPAKQFVRYAHPAALLLDVAKYHTLAPFAHHGAPALFNMLSAEAHGYHLAAYPVLEHYIEHLEAGTRRLYDGAWNPGDQQPARKWSAQDHYPI